MPAFPRQDLEAPLIKREAGGRDRFLKDLPLETAWHFFDSPDELLDAGHPAVEGVTTNAERIVINYAPGLVPMDLDSLRRMARPAGPMGVWRTVLLFSDLVDQLESLHRAGIVQQLVHPERVARGPNGLVLLPTFAEVIPPLGDLLDDPALSRWIFYAAPEVLRNRSLSSVDPRSDIYSFGRMLTAVCHVEGIPGTDDAHAFAERLVEHPESSSEIDLAESCLGLRPLVAQLCRPNPEDRPDLAAIREEFQELLVRHDPLSVMERLLEARNLAGAEALRTDLLDARQQEIGGDLDFVLGVVVADLELLKDPPDVEQAVALYDQAEGPKYWKFETRLRTARAYGGFGESRNFEEAARSYRRAFMLLLGRLTESNEEDMAAQDKTDPSPSEDVDSDSPPEDHGPLPWNENPVLEGLVDEWGTVLQSIGDPELVTELTGSVPMNCRSRKIVESRLRAKLALANPAEAWLEIVRYFVSRGYDEERDGEILRLAELAVQGLGTSFLMKWMAPHRNDDAYALPRSLVWRRGGNTEKAEEALALARRRETTAS